jgi:hypothetical protein
MGSSYVRIGLGPRLKYPKLCPFTGTVNPRKFVTVRYPRLGLRIPIPILGSLWEERTVGLRFKASGTKAAIDMGLKAVTVVSGVILFFTHFLSKMWQAAIENEHYRVPVSSQSDGSGIVIGIFLVIGIYLVSKILRAVNLQAVKIMNRDGNLVEVRFNRADYAKEFCELNGLVCHTRPFKERQAERRS